MKSKKYLLWLTFISVAFYFLSSLAFPILGESIVAPLMIICVVIGGISVLALLSVLIKQKWFH